MRILHVIGEMGFGGAEVLTAQMASSLVQSGYEVEVLVLGFCEAIVLADLRRAGVVVHAPRVRLASPINVFRISKLVAARRIDLVHAHLFPALYWAALARTFSPGRVKWVYTEHSTSNGRRHQAWLRPVERWVYGRFDVIACISAEAGASLVQWAPRVRPVLIENGIDLARFATATPLDRTSLDIAADSAVVLMVGAFRSEKNHAMLVQAFARLPTNYVLVLAGDGAERVPVEALAANLGVAARVRFLGAVPGVERLYRLADVYVLPSRFEGFGISALEAAAAGVPVVHSDVPGLADMLDGAGWPVDPGSAESIAEGIVRAAAAGRASSQVAHGHLVAARYGLDTTVARHVSLYQSLHAPGYAATPKLAGPRRREP